jgi:hypothetical protein
MATASFSNVAPGHPAPSRGEVGLTALLIGLIGAPFAWSVQIILGFALSAYACYPRRMSLPEPVLAGLRTELGLVSAAAIVLAALCTLVAYKSWARTRKEQESDGHVLLDAGEGRTRFMAMCGLLTSASFLVALIFTSLVLLLVQPCGL